MILHLFPNGQVERGTAKKPRDRPGYRWVPGYSQIFVRGMADVKAGRFTTSQPQTRREWYAVAQSQGHKCKFHASQEAAHKAVTLETT